MLSVTAGRHAGLSHHDALLDYHIHHDAMLDYHSRTPCWKSTTNSSRNLRWLMSWKSPYRPSVKSCHQNTSARSWQTSAGAGHGCHCQWSSLWASAVTLSISRSASSSQKQNISFQKNGKQCLNRWKLEINFFEGSAAALCIWGGQVNNFCVAYYVDILCAKYCKKNGQHMQTLQ